MNNIVLAINLVNYKNPEKQEAQDRALEILFRNATPNITVHSFNFLENDGSLDDWNGKLQIHRVLQRDSQKLIGNDRRLPYISEILDHASKIPGDIFGYMNTDILLTKNFFELLNGRYDAYIFSRYDIDKSDYFERDGFKIVNDKHPGFDAFFFDRIWWLLNSHVFNPNLILGEPAWDDYYNKKIKSHARKVLSQRALYHVRHLTQWNTNSSGAKNNICIYYEEK